MKEVFDILSDESGDLMIKNGDFVIGESSLQHIHDIVIAEKGEYKQYPMLGVGIRQELLSNTTEVELKHMIRKELELDGMTVEQIKFNHGEIDIDAYYE